MKFQSRHSVSWVAVIDADGSRHFATWLGKREVDLPDEYVEEGIIVECHRNYKGRREYYRYCGGDWECCDRPDALDRKEEEFRQAQKAKRQQLNDEAAQRNEAEGLPALNGSPKQNAWAESIRRAVLDHCSVFRLDKVCVVYRYGPPGKLIEFRDVEELRMIAAAKVWIEASFHGAWRTDTGEWRQGTTLPRDYQGVEALAETIKWVHGIHEESNNQEAITTETT